MFVTLLVVVLVIFGFGSHARRSQMVRQTAQAQRERNRQKPPRRVDMKPRQARTERPSNNVVALADPANDEDVELDTVSGSSDHKAGWVRGLGISKEDATRKCPAYDRAYSRVKDYVHQRICRNGLATFA